MTKTLSRQRNKQLALVVLSLVLTMTSIPDAFAAQVQTTTISNSDTTTANQSLLDQDTIMAPLRTEMAAVTAYTQAVDECDSTPNITADGTDLTKIKEDVAAVNFLPFGTKIRIPELFGDKVFVVHDRMNARYWYRVDILMKSKKVAFQFGFHRSAKIEIVSMGDGKTVYAKAAEAKRVAMIKSIEAEKTKTALADALVK